MDREEQIARNVRAIYNYNVGIPGLFGWLIIAAVIGCCLLYGLLGLAAWLDPSLLTKTLR